MGGTLVRHEVTATHTRSLFCSLQRFFFPSALVVAILLPIVHKESRGVAALPELHALCHPHSSGPPFSGTLAPRLLRVWRFALLEWQAPASHPGARLSFVRRYSLPRCCRVQSTVHGLSSFPLSAWLAETGAPPVCRAPNGPESPQPSESWVNPRRLCPELLTSRLSRLPH